MPERIRESRVAAERAEAARLVRTHGMLFLVTDGRGDVPSGLEEFGLFYQDTRYLSHYALEVEGARMVGLSSEASHEAYDQVDLLLTETAPDFLGDPQNFLHIRRRQILEGSLIEEIRFTNYHPHVVTLRPSIHFGADFADIFEVRGARRPRRGQYAEPRIEAQCVVLSYEGLCGTHYETHVAFGERPAALGADRATFELRLTPGQTLGLEVRVVPRREGHGRSGSRSTFASTFTRAAERLTRGADGFRARSTEWSCDDGRLQAVLERSAMDLHAMRIRMPSPDAFGRVVGEQRIVGAGVPWYSAPFGRDALLAAYEALSLNPDLAIEALRALAAYQGSRYDEEHEEEPGKIHHELRFGEMSRCGEVPFSPYYGSVDATPLFVVVASAYFETAGSLEALNGLRPNLERAMAWIDARTGEGTRFATYEKRSKRGLDNQGWKDSRAAVAFPDGRRAAPPIALCEVQGYCVDAYVRAEGLFRVLGDQERARAYGERGARLREAIEREMWLPEHGRYAFAIDGAGEKVPTVVSNPGHLLWSRVPSRAHAAATAELLLGSDLFSGFGIRTLGAQQAAYNPLSYHNGSVWPHDNALIADGLARYDLYPELARVTRGMYRALDHFRGWRIPELFCGVDRRSGPLVHYPGAGCPQAWAAASPFLLLQAILGLRPDAPGGRLRLRNPQLPDGLRRLEFRRMRIGRSVVCMRFRQVRGRCYVEDLDVTGDLKADVEMGET